MCTLSIHAVSSIVPEHLQNKYWLQISFSIFDMAFRCAFCAPRIWFLCSSIAASITYMNLFFFVFYFSYIFVGCFPIQLFKMMFDCVPIVRFRCRLVVVVGSCSKRKINEQEIKGRSQSHIFAMFTKSDHWSHRYRFFEREKQELRDREWERTWEL